jgi:hypothetical protein
MTDQAYWEMVQEEEGAKLGDPRRCLRHPHVKTSSPDGMFDGLCGACEADTDDEPTVYGNDAPAMLAPSAPVDSDEIPF